MRMIAALFALLAFPASAQVTGQYPAFPYPLTTGNCIKALNTFQGQDAGGPCAISGGAGSFTTLTASSTVTFNMSNASFSLAPTGTGTATINPTTAGTLNNMVIGGSTALAGTFTALTATNAVALSPANANVVASPTGTGTVTLNPATAGTINNMSFGQSTPLPVTATALKTTGTSLTFQSAGVTGTLNWTPASTNKAITLPNGTTDFTGTGGTSQVVKQTSAGAAFTVARLACADLSDSGTGCTTTVGTAATVNTGTSGATIPLLNGANTYSGVSLFSSGVAVGTATGSTGGLSVTSARTAIVADSWVFDNNGASFARAFSYGHDSSTNGNFYFSSRRGNDTNEIVVWQSSSTGTITLGATAYANCTALTTTSGLIGCTASDPRIKNDHGTISPQRGLAMIMSSPDAHRFTFKDGYGPAGTHYGFMANDISKRMPELVSRGVPSELTPDGTLQFDKAELGPIAIQAIKALKADNDNLRRRIEVLETRRAAR